MTFEGPEVPQGGPRGYRHQFNNTESRLGTLGPRVHNDPAGEVGRSLNVKDFDLERLFGRDGVQLLHLSGLIAGLSPETATFCLELVRAAREHGTRISFDLNYRETFWLGRVDELHKVFCEIASLSDVLVGNEEDFQQCLKVQGPELGKKKNLTQKMDGFEKMIERARAAYPDAQVFATTLREELSVNRHLWGAIMWEKSVGLQKVEPREIGVIDRIGGGDGFVGGLLYGILRSTADPKQFGDPTRWLEFGWACGALATTMLTDYAHPADEDQVWSIWEGVSKVKR